MFVDLLVGEEVGEELVHQEGVGQALLEEGVQSQLVLGVELPESSPVLRLA